ncbi:conserved hypothetical protein [Leishmania braziliensis MHOM/BR/75/M2904]|uniref:Uncharacterized protein n=2 Tax=Leishmania braziliensis TaxID=5660 RepID=A4H4N8_LEIBR|nr:conserved hypothetical protein [Leishmania braziliensis MHOM/BR/75/M2904]CAJ2466628.1 unnamed protein product [Leishmania braziliensis]CAM37031.2 conserved hypothetical protein [Leishmania braziliensis MHOM/BR/75/M2904]SYZ62901.1 hypothetical_protein [Leishmania braziliensis MHOM/BR/75/M2904]
MMLSSSSSSSSGRWRSSHSQLVSQQPLRPYHQREQQSQEMLQGNAHFASLLQRPREGPPQPQVVTHTTVPGPLVAPALPARQQQQLPVPRPSSCATPATFSPRAFVQVQPQLQRGCEDVQHQRVPAGGTSATVASVGGGDGLDDSSSPAPSTANVAEWWSRDGSLLSHQDESDSTSCDGTYQLATTSSTMTDQRSASPKQAAPVELGDDATCLSDLRRRVAAQVEKCGPRRPAGPGAAAASTALVSQSLSTSSCGCPTSCTCRSDTPDGDVFVVSADAHRRARRASHARPARQPHTPSTAARRDAYPSCKARGTQYMTYCSDASSETGTTPVQWSSDKDSDSLCSSCCRCHCDCSLSFRERRHAQHEDTEFPSKLSTASSTEGSRGSGDDASLCSFCRGAAHAGAMRRRGTAASFTHQDNPCRDALRGDRLSAEVPLLLRLSTSGASCVPMGGSAGYAATRVELEQADRRLACLQGAPALLGDAAGERRGAYDGVTAAVRQPDRCTGSAQTEAVTATAPTASQSEEQRCRHAEKEAAEWKSLAAAHCAEVALPLLQDELASFEARTAVQQQAHLDVVAAQMRAFHDEVRQRTRELMDLQLQYQRQLEQQHVTQQGEAEAAGRTAARVDCATSPMETSRAAAAGEPTPKAAPPSVPLQRDVGTQHSDGTLELLAAVRTEAASWVAQQLLFMEAERRDTVAQDEAESRDRLLNVVEGPCRSQLLLCQAQLLHWQQECAAVRQRTFLAADLHALELRERLARQELTGESSLAQHELFESFEKQRCQAAEEAVHSQVKLLKDELTSVQSKLEMVEAEHADTLEHARQLRLQLVHALRMPTVTLVDRSAVSTATCVAGDAAIAAAAYAYATATAGTEHGGAVGILGETSQGGTDITSNAHAASSTGLGTGAVGWHTLLSGIDGGLDLPVHRRFAHAHQEALRVTRAQSRTV